MMRSVIALYQRMVDQAALTLMVQLQFANKLRDRSVIIFQDKNVQVFQDSNVTRYQDKNARMYQENNAIMY